MHNANISALFISSQVIGSFKCFVSADEKEGGKEKTWQKETIMQKSNAHAIEKQNQKY